MAKRPYLTWIVVMIVVLGFSIAAFAQTIELELLKPGGKNEYEEEVEFAAEYRENVNAGVNVEVISVGWGDAYQKLMSGVAANNAPDIMYVGTRWVPTLVSMGAVAPLPMDAQKLLLYHDGLQESIVFGSEVYAVPRAFSTKALFYRTDLIDSPPQTWEELIEVAKKVQEENPGMYGFGIAGAKHVSTTSQFFNFLFQNGGRVFDEAGNVMINDEAGVEALQFYTDLYRVHKVVPNPIEYNREQLPELFKNGTIAMYISGPWGKVISGLEPDNPDLPYATTLLPAGKQRATILVSDSLVISADSGNQEAAWEYVEYWTTLENQKRYDLGHGLVPIMKPETTMPEFTEDPYFKPFVDMAKYGVAQPKPLAWEPFQDILTDAIQKSLLGEATPQEALDEAAERIMAEGLEPK